MKPAILSLICLVFVSTGLLAATPGTVTVIDYEEGSRFWFLDPMNNPTSWSCSAEVPPDRCYANFASGDVYILNGLLAVDPKLPDNRIYYYVHLYSKSDNPSIAGPAYHYEDASFVVMTTPRSWHGMRGTGLVLERDDIRPEDFREWTMHHAIYDSTPQKFFVTTTTPRNGSNDATTGYVDGFVVVGTSSDGIHDFDWRNIIKFERVHNYRFLGIFFFPDAGSCSNSNCQYSGVLTWLRHTEPSGGGYYGTTPIRYRPCFGSCSDQGQIDIKISGQGWQTFTIPSNNTGVNLGAQGIQPERTIIGRTIGYLKATFSGVTQYELWRDLKSVTLAPDSWAPCDPTSEPYQTNRTAWPADKGGQIQYRRYDPVAGASVDSDWIDFESPTRNIAPAHYNMWVTWIVGRVDYGLTNMLYLANRDNHICMDGNDWDTGTGKGVQWIQLGESLGTNQ